jgi:hypothetical protein
MGAGAATSGGQAEGISASVQEANAPYDGRFAFVRLRYGAEGGNIRGNLLFGRGGREPMWSHDAPRAEHNFLRIMEEVTSVWTSPDSRLILSLDDDELFRYPVAYIVEPGYWFPTDSEVLALQTWLLKGGFLIVDDFRGGHRINFEAQMRRVMPAAKLMVLGGQEEIFDSFFHITDPYSLIPPYAQNLAPVYLGVFEDNDPNRRLMVIANYNNDIAEYWEFSDYGYYPIDLSNEAYKFGVNYVMYALTH